MPYNDIWFWTPIMVWGLLVIDAIIQHKGETNYEVTPDLLQKEDDKGLD